MKETANDEKGSYLLGAWGQGGRHGGSKDDLRPSLCQINATMTRITRGRSDRSQNRTPNQWVTIADDPAEPACLKDLVRKMGISPVLDAPVDGSARSGNLSADFTARELNNSCISCPYGGMTY
ncbi:hypothetical protein [Afipia felis]